MTSVTTDLTIRKATTVARDVDDAFELFTDRIGTWWPADTHSIGGAEVDVVFEPRVGGRVYERAPDGRTSEWATVLAYDRPHRVLLEWRVGTERAPYTEGEIRFARAAGGTRVELEHRGWDDADGRANYRTGWDPVLVRFVEAAQSVSE